MSTNKHTNPAYISHVHLKGYKSILDTEVELHPGLNIIIGPNGSGKTNFLEFLYSILSSKHIAIRSVFSGILSVFFNEDSKPFDYKFHKAITINPQSKKLEEHLIEELSGGNQDISIKSSVESYSLSPSLQSRFPYWSMVSPVWVKFGLPHEIKNLEQSIRFEGTVLTVFEVDNHPFLDYNFIPKINIGTQELLKDYFNQTIFKDYGSELIPRPSLEMVKKNLEKYTPISSLRILPKPKLDKKNETYRADYLNFEFLIQGNWLKWSQLSDGTKRLFYIVIEVTLNEGICLIEEPELGVHPDQYRKILNFLKEQSEEKQIIITTHAPKTLDILEDDELDRIILTRYEKDLGTKMRHLSKEEQEHAVKFMREESFFLSDFWTMTSFFDEEEEVI